MVKGWSQVIFLARRTRTVKLCSPGTRARLGALGVGRVKMVRSKGQHRPLPQREVKALARANGTSRVPLGGLVRMSRAVEDQSAPILEEITSELGGNMMALTPLAEA